MTREALKRISERLRRAGASLPAPDVTTTTTIKGYIDHGLCMALAIVETEIEALAQPEQEQESVAWLCEIDDADFEENTITLKMLQSDYVIRDGLHWLSITPPAQQAPAQVLMENDGWLQDGGVLYRMTDERKPQNRDEISVTMADGSRSVESRTRSARELLDRIRATPPAQSQHKPCIDITFMRQVVGIAICGLFEHYKEDVVKVFDLDTLQDVTELTKDFGDQRVEDIYKRAWEMLAAHGITDKGGAA